MGREKPVAPSAHSRDVLIRRPFLRSVRRRALLFQGSGVFGPVPDPAEHLLAHHEADHLHGLGERIQRQQGRRQNQRSRHVPLAGRCGRPFFLPGQALGPC